MAIWDEDCYVVKPQFLLPWLELLYIDICNFYNIVPPASNKEIVMVERIVVVTNGISIELYIGMYNRLPVVGDEVQQWDPESKPGNWRVIKVFEKDDNLRLRALIALMGFEAVQELFSIIGVAIEITHTVTSTIDVGRECHEGVC